MLDNIIITLLESIYLIFMFFFYKTSYSINGAKYEKETHTLGSYFIHDTGHYENKICLFGKIMAILAILLASVRLYFMSKYPQYKRNLFLYSIGFDSICILLAVTMNLNAFVYLLPILLGEIYIMAVSED